jgi:hypothetical protein
MEDLIYLWIRLSRALAAGVKAAAKQMGVSKAEFARRALEHFQVQHMQDQMADLSRRVAKESADAGRSMEGSSADGLT